tara:strand:+ start:357 stop:578 length:222 start_codon:yes stop_codon:yes gene_type:complete
MSALVVCLIIVGCFFRTATQLFDEEQLDICMSAATGQNIETPLQLAFGFWLLPVAMFFVSILIGCCTLAGEPP